MGASGSGQHILTVLGVGLTVYIRLPNVDYDQFVLLTMDPDELEDEELEEIRYLNLSILYKCFPDGCSSRYEDFTTIGSHTALVLRLLNSRVLIRGNRLDPRLYSRKKAKAKTCQNFLYTTFSRLTRFRCDTHRLGALQKRNERGPDVVCSQHCW